MARNPGLRTFPARVRLNSLSLHIPKQDKVLACTPFSIDELAIDRITGKFELTGFKSRRDDMFVAQDVSPGFDS
jgi:hypothetical protein